MRKYWLHVERSFTFILTNSENCYYYYDLSSPIWRKAQNYVSASVEDRIKKYPEDYIVEISEKKLLLMGVTLYEKN